MVAIDGSEYSLKAAEYALGIAKSFGAQLYAVTVTYTPKSYPVKQEEIIAESKEESDSINNDAKTWFEKFNQDAKEKNIELNTELINGYRSWPLIPVPAEHLLLEYAEKENMDLIVVGTRERSAFKRLLIGSVASGVVKHAHCTVMVVR